MKTLFLYLVILFSLFFSCSSTPKINVVGESGESCLSKFEQRDMVMLAKDKTIQGIKSSASYLLSGAAYTGDVLLLFTEATVLGALTCLPAAVVASGVNDVCILPHVKRYESNDSLGRVVSERTIKWRCPEVNYISKGIRAISKCQFEKGKIKSAEANLKFLKETKDIYACLSSDERRNIASLYNKINE